MTRTELINYIIKKQGYTSYLEIGIGTGRNFKAIECDEKEGVDPSVLGKGIFTTTSNDFFGLVKSNKHSGEIITDTNSPYDLIFIDGLHHADQVRRDIINSWECLNDGGCLVIHDTNPDREEITHVPRDSKEWTGDVYQAIYQVKNYKVTYEGDHGVTIIRKDGPLQLSDDKITWEEFDAFRDEVLNLRNWQETIKTINTWTKVPA